MQNKHLSPLTAIGSLLVLAAPLVLTGCGGGGSSSGSGSSTTNTGGPGTTATTAQAFTGLNTLVGSSVSAGGTPSTGSVATVEAQFQSAVTANPNDPNARAGLAITQAAAAVGTADSLLGGPLSGIASAAKPLAAARVTRLAQLVPLLQVWKMTGAGGSAVPQGSDMLPTPLITSTSGSGSSGSASSGTTDVVEEVTQDVAAIDAQLATAETNLNEALTLIGNNNNFQLSNGAGQVFSFQAANGNGVTQTYYIGKAELYALGGVIAAIRSLDNVSLAYDLDPGAFTGSFVLETQYPTAFAAAGGSGGALTPAQYLPPSPFLTLNSGGTQNMQTALHELQALVTDATDGLDVIQARVSGGTNNEYPLSGSAFTATDISTYLGLVQQYGAIVNTPGEQTVTFPASGGGTESVKLDVYDFLNNPPSSLEAYAPTLTINSQSSDGSYEVTGTSFGQPIDANVTAATDDNDLLNQIGQSVEADVFEYAASSNVKRG